MLPYVDPMFAYVGRTNALPHSSDRNGGGGDGVGTGWGGGRPTRSAAGAARLYNLRLPPKASGKDTGDPSWPAPGFKGSRLTAGRRPKGAMLALCWPLLDLSGPYVASMFAHVSRMLAHVGPMLA